MSAQHSLCNSFRLELLQGVHDFTSDTFKCALYTSSASIGASTTAYSTTNEVSGTGYTAGGATLTVASGYPKVNASAEYGIAAGRVALVDFNDTSWSGSNFSARYGLIYNSSKSNKAVAVIDFGADVGVNLVIQWISPNASQATIRIS